MALLGRWNWWAPRPLGRLHSRLGLAESRDPSAGRGHRARAADADALARQVGDRWWVVAARSAASSPFLTRDDGGGRRPTARRPRSLTVHFVEPPQAGPVEVATVERGGRSATTWPAARAGRPAVALALGSCAVVARRRAGVGRPAPDARRPTRAGASSRGTRGRASSTAARSARATGLRRRAATSRGCGSIPRGPLDHLALTALSDGWMPAAFSTRPVRRRRRRST